MGKRDNRRVINTEIFSLFFNERMSRDDRVVKI